MHSLSHTLSSPACTLPGENSSRDALQTGFLFVDTAGYVTFSTPIAERLLHIRPGEAMAQPFTKLCRHMLAHIGNGEYDDAELTRFWHENNEESYMALRPTDSSDAQLHINRHLVRDSCGHWLGYGILLHQTELADDDCKDQREMFDWAQYEMRMSLTIIKACATALLEERSRHHVHIQKELIRMIDTYTDKLTEAVQTLQ